MFRLCLTCLLLHPCRSSTLRTWRMKWMSSYKSLRRRATGLFFTPSVSTDTHTIEICNRSQAIKQYMDTHTSYSSDIYNTIHTQCAYTATRTRTHTHSFGSGPNKWLLLDMMGFSSMQRTDSLLSLCLYFCGSRSGQGPPSIPVQ